MDSRVRNEQRTSKNRQETHGEVIEARRGLGKALVMPQVAGLEQRQTAAEGLAVRTMRIGVLTRGIREAHNHDRITQAGPNHTGPSGRQGT